MTRSPRKQRKQKSAQPLSPSQCINIGGREKTSTPAVAKKRRKTAIHASKDTTNIKASNIDPPSIVNSTSNIDHTIDWNLRTEMCHATEYPNDINSNDKYHPGVVKIAKAVEAFTVTFETLRPDIRTADKKEVRLNLPSLPLGLPKDKLLNALSLYYLTQQDADGLKDLSCFTATRSNGSIRCKCWEMVRLAVGDKTYFSAVGLDVCPIDIPHETTLDGYVGKQMAMKIMMAYLEVIFVILQSVDNFAFCAQSAAKAFSQYAYDDEKDIERNFNDKKKHHLLAKVISLSSHELKLPPHPCTLLHPGKQSHFATKAATWDKFGSILRRLTDPNAEECRLFSLIRESNSVFFDLLQQAAIQSCINGGKESGRLRRKGRSVALYLVSSGIAKHLYEAATMISRYADGEAIPSKYNSMQSLYMSSCELWLARFIAEELVENKLAESKHAASKSSEFIQRLATEGNFSMEKATSIAARYQSSCATELASSIAEEIVQNDRAESRHAASKTEEMVDSLVEQGKCSVDEAKSIAARYEGSARPKTTISDTKWNEHHSSMQTLWKQADPKVKVRITKENGTEVDVLVIPSNGNTKPLYRYVQDIIRLGDERYEILKSEFNVDHLKDAQKALRMMRGKARKSK